MTRSIPKLAKLSTNDKTRKHGPSRLEKLLQDSIRHEIKIRSLRRELLALSAKIALIERCPSVECDL